MAARQRPQGVEHRLMFDRAGDEMTTAGGFERLRDTAQREVVRLGAAACKYHFRGISANDERASSSIAFACCPKRCTLDALPKISRLARPTISITSGARGVVAL